MPAAQGALAAASGGHKGCEHTGVLVLDSSGLLRGAAPVGLPALRGPVCACVSVVPGYTDSLLLCDRAQELPVSVRKGTQLRNTLSARGPCRLASAWRWKPPALEAGCADACGGLEDVY